MAASDQPRPEPLDRAGEPSPTAGASPTPAQSDLARTKPAVVLVADDDRITRELLADILQVHGYKVETAEDGQQAVERVSRGGVDLVLLDIMMPRLSGLEACRLLKGMTTETFLPVVLVTVKTDGASRVEGLRIGADDYVCKPFEEKELVARVQAMLRIKHLHDHVVEARQKLDQMSLHDELTGLRNYRYLNTRLMEEFKRAERYHDPLACALVDIDGLKVFNEKGGRAFGDEIIREVANALRSCVRDMDVVARYGGEEFLVVLPGTHFGGAVTAGERMWRGVSERRFDVGENRGVGVSVSIGIGLYPSRDVRTRDALVRGADGALQQAKRDGGNRVCVYQQQGYVYTPSLGSRSAAPPTTPENDITKGSR